MVKDAVVDLITSAADAQRIVREIAVDTDNIFLTKHACERMEERGFDLKDLFDVLRRGFVDDMPEFNGEKNEWKCKVVKQLNYGRDAGVITAILRVGKLVILTMEWEDL